MVSPLIKFSLLLLTLTLTSCATGIQATRYPVDTTNVSKLRSSKPSIKSIRYSSKLTYTNRKGLECRGGSDAIGLGELTVLQYLEKALQDEVLMAGALNDNGNDIHIEITQLENFTMKIPRWEIAAILRIQNMEYKINYSNKIEYAFNGITMCNYALAALGDLITGFNRLVIEQILKV